MDTKPTTVLVTGGNGFLGKAVCKTFRKAGYHVEAPDRRTVNFLNEDDTFAVMRWVKPDYVVHCAANCGGISANQQNPGTMFADNMVLSANVLRAAALRGTKVVIIGTACSYSPECYLYTSEHELYSHPLTGPTAPYGYAKLAILEMARAFKRQFSSFDYSYVIPSNIYGPGDHFGSPDAHVIPALVSKFLRTRSDEKICVWGFPDVTRDFVYVDDVAKGILAAMERGMGKGPINLSSEQEIRMDKIVRVLQKITGNPAEVVYSRGEALVGHWRRVISSEKAHQQLGWRARTSFLTGMRRTVADADKFFADILR